MPTYKNDSGTTFKVTNTAGKEIGLLPGQQFEGYDFLDNPGLTKLSDAPFYNPVIANEQVVFAGAETQEISVDPFLAVDVLVWQVEGCNVTVFQQDQTNSPPWAYLRPTGKTVIPVKRRFNKLILVSDGAGSCNAAQYKEDIE